MTKFEVGDKFIPRKPKGEKWNINMDLYDGEVLTVEKITSEGYIEPYEWGVYLFHPDWCEKVEENSITKESFLIKIRKMLDEHLPADGLGTEREKLRMILHNEITNLITETITTDHIPDINVAKEGQYKFTKEDYIANMREKSGKILPASEPWYNIPNRKTIDWEQRRYELAKAAMQGILSNSVYHHAITVASDERRVNQLRGLVDISLQTAESMIELLKETEEQLKEQ